MSGRPAAVLALLVLGAALLAVLALTTPWSPLPGPVPGGRHAVAPLRDFTAAERAYENAFHRAVRPPAYAGLVAGLVAAGVLGLTPLGARLVERAGRPLGGGWGWQVVLGGLAVTLVGRLATLGFDAWAEVVLRRYQLSTQSWSGWAVDQLRSLGISAGVLVLALLGFYALARAFPRTWWAWVALGGAALVLVASFLYPLLVEPAFNRFTPLAAGPLRTSLLELAARDGVPVREVLVADASRRTTALNAYVSGFGSTRRVVVYDTLLRSATPAEVRLIVAHELGHAKRQDVLHGTLEGALGAAAASCLAFLLISAGPLLRRAGAVGAGDPRSVALLLLLVAAAGVLLTPASSLVSRRIEARADVHSLELTRDPLTFARIERRLSLANRSDLDPNPVVYGLFATHPTGPERIALARDWARQNGVEPPPALVP
ncbi:MAG: M48 family metallopeptidase [Actinomycetota bacterium]|nr:M48 family metallopeptidase [Actinomycetota bacterium]